MSGSPGAGAGALYQMIAQGGSRPDLLSSELGPIMRAYADLATARRAQMETLAQKLSLESKAKAGQAIAGGTNPDGSPNAYATGQILKKNANNSYPDALAVALGQKESLANTTTSLAQQGVRRNWLGSALVAAYNSPNPTAVLKKTIFPHLTDMGMPPELQAKLATSLLDPKLTPEALRSRIASVAQAVQKDAQDAKGLVTHQEITPNAEVEVQGMGGGQSPNAWLTPSGLLPGTVTNAEGKSIAITTPVAQHPVPAGGAPVPGAPPPEAAAAGTPGFVSAVRPPMPAGVSLPPPGAAGPPAMGHPADGAPLPTATPQVAQNGQPTVTTPPMVAPPTESPLPAAPRGAIITGSNDVGIGEEAPLKAAGALSAEAPTDLVAIRQHLSVLQQLAKNLPDAIVGQNATQRQEVMRALATLNGGKEAQNVAQATDELNKYLAQSTALAAAPNLSPVTKHLTDERMQLIAQGNPQSGYNKGTLKDLVHYAAAVLEQRQMLLEGAVKYRHNPDGLNQWMAQYGSKIDPSVLYWSQLDPKARVAFQAKLKSIPGQYANFKASVEAMSKMQQAGIIPQF